MIYGHRDSSRYLYHYTKSKIALDCILPSHKLMFGNYVNTNDPKETKHWEFSIGTNENRDLSKYDMNDLSNRLSHAFKSQTKVLCFSKDDNELSGNHISDIYKRGFCKPRMWAQYCENHTGICLVFDWQKIEKIVEERFSCDFLVLNGAVNYKNRGIVPSRNESDYCINIDYLERYGFNDYASAHFKKYYRRLFFEKLADWHQENEYRWIVVADTTKPIFIDFKDSLVGIIFGESTKDKDIDKAITLTDNSIQYTGLKWKNCSPWYDLVNIKYMNGIQYK